MSRDHAAGPVGQRILVRLPNWLGDALMARPLLFALRRSFPGAEIAAVAPAPLLALLRADRTVDREEPWPAGAPARGNLVGRLRAWAPDAALVLPPSFSSAWVARRTRARRRIGYRHELRGALLTEALPRMPRGERHLADEYLALGARIGAVPAPVPALRPPAEGERAAAARIAAAGWSGRPLALLAPGARYGPAKRWDAERFAAVGRALAAAGHAVAACGGAEDGAVADQVARASGGEVASLAGRTELPELAGLCARAAVVISNDSGTAHLAAACGTRTVVIFGSTSPGWTAPLGAAVRVVQRAPVCAPCFQRRCRIGTPCLCAIGADEVLAACAGGAGVPV